MGRRMSYTGPCVGGPCKGQWMERLEPQYRMCRMARSPPGWEREKDPVPWVEIDRGSYQFTAGIWWWMGWEKGR